MNRTLPIRIVALCAAMFITPRAGAAQMPGMPGMKDMKGMTDSPFGIPMDRMGSGTTWIPDAAPLPSKAFKAGSWDMMLHAFVFAQYDAQRGPRGATQLGSLNWAMVMASRPFAGGRFQARTMLSLDPATVTSRGYPLLLQSGETHDGEPIVDRQHPHDFLMELGVLYERAIAGPVGISLYAAPSGEPALGPVAFMHRPSGIENPMAPLGHHWQDATHIAFGVLTAGLFGRAWKIEGSLFNGREPDERRWNIDRMRLDSYSARVTVNPNAQWSLTAGYGFLESPEAHTPEESMHRVTGSVLHSAPFRTDGERALSLVWGANKHRGASLTHSVGVESRVAFDARNTVFGRAEHVQKSAHDLAIAGVDGDRRLGVSSVSLGYTREVYKARGATIGIGGIGTINVVPSAIRTEYGSRTPLGAMLFLRVRPAGGDAMMDMSHQ